MDDGAFVTISVESMNETVIGKLLHLNLAYLFDRFDLAYTVSEILPYFNR